MTVDGRSASKPAQQIAAEAVVTLTGEDAYVSRAAGKLAAALDAFAIEVSGRLVLDVGASTGGFTQVLLERGAREVIALDVGHDQLVPALRDDPRVRVVEGVNARSLTPAQLATEAGTGEVPSFAVADVSFIALPMILPAMRSTLGAGCEAVVLVKPQFEVGRTGIREGVVRDRAARHDALMNVLWAAWDVGWGTAGVISSPVVGGSGNQEYLVWLSGPAGRNPTEWGEAVSALV